MQVCEAQPGDIPAILEMAERNVAELGHGLEFKPEHLAGICDRAMEDDDALLLVGLDDDHAPVAMLGAGVTCMWFDPDYRLGLVYVMWVDEEHRGGPLAGLMIEAAEAWAERAQVDAITFSTSDRGDGKGLRSGAMFLRRDYHVHETLFKKRI